MNGVINKRENGIDILKAICAFGVVCIHVSFSGGIGDYYIALQRVAVPIFFMISGYFYRGNVCEKDKYYNIKKAFIIMIKANILYFCLKLCICIISGDSVDLFLGNIFSNKNIVKFILFNESPVAGHLWYLSAILYVYIIMSLFDVERHKKFTYFLIPAFLIGDLLLGKYSVLLFEREFPFLLVRNFLFVGIPYFCIGRLLNNKYRDNVYISKKKVVMGIVIFTFTTFMERFIITYFDANTMRDHYISTTFLAVMLFIFAMQNKNSNNDLVRVGREYSAGIYIIHPIIIKAIDCIVERKQSFIFSLLISIVVYVFSLLIVILYKKLIEYR